MKKKIILTALLFFSVLALTSGVKYISAAGNVNGWLWGGSEASSDGLINGNETGLGAIVVNGDDEVGGVDYGVTFPSGDGNVSGYAWSENLGYIDFSPAGPFPATPANSVQRVGNNLTGWARFKEIEIASASGNSGGWSGWIKMSGPGYGVTVNSGSLAGYAWSDELGFIDFSGVTLPAPPSINLFTATPPKVNIENNPNFLTTANNVTLTWDADNADSCEVLANSNPLLSGLSPSGSQTVSQTSGFVNYTLTCTGSISPDDSEVRSVYTYCYNSACGASDLCENTENQGATNVSQCTKECSSDAACVPVSTGDWREVTP